MGRSGLRQGTKVEDFLFQLELPQACFGIPGLRYSF
jgi:hypothetical protein